MRLAHGRRASLPVGLGLALATYKCHLTLSEPCTDAYCKFIRLHRSTVDLISIRVMLNELSSGYTVMTVKRKAVNAPYRLNIAVRIK